MAPGNINYGGELLRTLVAEVVLLETKDTGKFRGHMFRPDFVSLALNCLG